MINKLKLNPDNPRSMPDSQFERLKGKIKEFPEMLEKRPIVYDENNIVLGGNQRLRVLRALAKDGFEIKDEYFTDASGWTEEQKRNFVINDNISDGDWDEDILADKWDDLPLEDWGIDGISWDTDDVIEDEAPEVDDGEPVSKLGEVYQLGRHRLMCGDSTKIEDVEKLMNGQKADMVFTDPPYGISKPIANDDLSEDELREWNKRWLPHTLSFSTDDAHFVCFHSTRLFNTVLRYAEDLGWDFERYLTLYKPNDITFPWHGWILKSEAVLLFSKGNPDYENVKPFMHDTMVYNNSSNFKEDVGGHPTVKLIGMVIDLIKRFKTSNILDLFGGSGSTLIACEQTNRTCYMMELDPKYCDVIRKRYHKFVTDSEEGWAEATPVIK